MKFAWIENNRVRDVCSGDPSNLYHPDVAKFYVTQVPDDACSGDDWINGQLIKAPAPELTRPRTWTQNDVRSNLTLAEKVKWDNDATPEIKTVKVEMSGPVEKMQIAELMKFLVDSGNISQNSMDKIMDGVIVTPVQVLP